MKLEQFNNLPYVDIDINYKSYQIKTTFIKKWTLDIYFEWKEKYSWWRLKKVFDTFEELEKFLNEYTLDYNLEIRDMVIIPTESQETIQLANWLRANNYMFTKNANETFTKFWNVKRKNTLEWVSKWVPDMMIILKKWALLFIELKRQKKILKSWKLSSSNSQISAEQVNWINELNKIKNVQAEICYGADEAINLIKRLENE